MKDIQESASLDIRSVGALVKRGSYLLSIVGRMAHRLRLRGPLAADPNARLFHMFLSVVGIWMLVGAVSTLPVAAVTFRRILIISLMWLVLIASLIVIRLGYYRAASLTYLIGTWIAATVTISSTAGIHSPVLTLYVALPVTAAWLLGYHAALWSVGVCMATMLVYLVLDMAGMSPPTALPPNSLGIWFNAGLAMLISTIPVGQVIRRLLATLAERKQVEDALRTSEERLRLATQATNDAIWDIDLNAGTVSWNDTYAVLYGRPETADSWQFWIDRIHPEDRDRTVNEFKSAIGCGAASWSAEYRFRRADGNWADIYDRAYIARDKAGNPWRVIGAMQDLTERKAAEEVLRERQKLESLGTLAGGIAHDFNNLLGAIQAQTDLALSELDAGSPCKDELRAIGDVAMRGSEIVRQLMVYAGKESEVLEVVDISKTVEEMLPLLKFSVSKHAVITADLGQHLPVLYANRAQLRQIVMNLVTNASESLGETDGFIRVATRCLNVGPDSTAAISDRIPAGNYLELQVADTGCGMSLETRARLFDPFFTTKSAGHGLGLAVVNGIVRSRGGAIRVTSELGKGTTFQVLLPCTESTVEAPTCVVPTNSVSANPSRQATVLVVEDEDDLRRAVAKMLRKASFQVVEAADGSSAIHLLRSGVDKVDLILLDITIPGAPSSEVITEAARIRPDIRVILTSAYSQEMMAALLSASQVRAFIRKPFRFVDLVSTVTRAASA